MKSAHAALAAACCFCVLACEGLSSGEDRPVAIEVVGLPDSIVVGDTVPIHVRVFNRSGDSIVGAPIVLVSLNPDTLGVDSAGVALFGKVKGTGRAVARSDDLTSAPFTVPIK